MMEAHEEIVILCTMASQVNTLDERFSDFDSFKQDITSWIKSILQSQNELKQELFLVRNSHAALVQELAD